jgi:hypothetical protein
MAQKKFLPRKMGSRDPCPAGGKTGRRERLVELIRRSTVMLHYPSPGKELSNKREETERDRLSG